MLSLGFACLITKIEKAVYCCQFNRENFNIILENLLKSGQAKKNMFENMTEVKPTDTTEEEQETSFQSSSGCSICNKEFEEDNEHLGHDCHFTCIQRRHTCRMYCNYSFQCFIVSTIFRNLKQNNDGNI